MECLIMCILFLLFPIIFWLWDMYNKMKMDFSFCEPLPPGSFGIPVIGESISFLMKGSSFFDSKLKHGKIYKTHLFGNPVVRVIGENNAICILAGENEIVTSHWPESTRMLLNGGFILEKTGSIHSHKKRAVLKSLTQNALDKYIPDFVQLCNIYINTWCQKKLVFTYPELRRLTFHVACKTLVGFSLSSDDVSRTMNLFQCLVNGLFSLPIQFPLFAFRKAIVARDELLQRIECQLHSPGQRSCPNIFFFLQPLIEQGTLNRSDVKHICLDLLFASHETTSSAACFLILYLSKYRDVFCKLRTELEDNGILDTSETLSLDNVNDLKYLNNVVKETIRLCCPIGAAYRKVLKTFILGGYQIPKGWLLAYSLRETNETSEFFTSPREFNPDRWTDKVDENSRHFLCFGGGKRRCVGKEFAMLFLKVLIIQMMRLCDWNAEKLNPEIIYFPSPHPRDGMLASFVNSTH